MMFTFKEIGDFYHKVRSFFTAFFISHNALQFH
ncbi:hypothetical protein CF65_01314 [Aggregatibacter actinomycetemcomitans HK1651]|nr:hypothetical protein CF65_01314 [Aggregatibacter actinomycetemcomitans HK1651]